MDNDTSNDTDATGDSSLPAVAGSVRAFDVYCSRLSEGGIYGKTSASKAKVAALVSAREVGYDINFRDLRVKRATKYDAIASMINGFGATYDHAEHLLLQNHEVRGAGISV